MSHDSSYVANLCPPLVDPKTWGNKRARALKRVLLEIFLGAQSGKDFEFKSWTASGAPDKCSKYRGVKCDAEGKIVAINATTARLVGPIDVLSSLDQLQRLDVSYNGDVEVLPQSFTKLKKLIHLNVYDCWIKGRIPSFLGQLTALTYLSVGGNPLEGAVPASLGNLVNLVFLNLAGTGEDGIGGALPSSFANLKKLKELYLRNNRFSGPLPEYIGSFTNLERLTVSKNYWEGSIPKTLSQLKKLKYLGLMETAFEGEIPTFLGTLGQLTYLSLSDTRLYGQVPKALSGLAKLKELYLNNGWYYGPLPDLSGLKQLTLIQSRSTTSCLPAHSFLSLSCLYSSRAYVCILSLPFGSIASLHPTSLPSLIFFLTCFFPILLISPPSTTHSPPLSDLSGNYFSGPIPAFLQRVKKVNAADNYFSGSASSLPCSDDFSVTGNCLSSVPSKCGGTAGQKTTEECNKFCGTATATGACSGKGMCVLDVAQLLKTQAYVPMCKCQSGYWASHQKMRCSKNNT
ncbi:unnamed protein product [Closterium sp. NIES-65]|nr:unnamed protein product [Closterium sp. NIES-65]